MRLLPKFQFQTGAIKSFVPIDFSPYMICFNSKLVRLKASCALDLDATCVSFNSKLVRLKVACNAIALSSSMFQFQTGAIKRIRSSSSRIRCRSFNSKLVRLKVRFSIAFLYEKECFNSKLVRLKVATAWVDQRLYAVSIPNWCD